MRQISDRALMRFARWPLLFFLVYGVLWIRARVRPAEPLVSRTDQPTAQQSRNDGRTNSAMKSILSEDPKSKESLSYALSKLSGRARAPSSVIVPEPSSFEKTLTELQSLRGDPARALQVVRKELRALDAGHVVERSILIREAYLVFDRDLSAEMAELLEEERDWLTDNVNEIADPTSLHGYVFEITRFSIQNAEDSRDRAETLRSMVVQLASNPAAIKSLQTAVLEYAEWDLPALIQSAPPEARSVLGGKHP